MRVRTALVTPIRVEGLSKIFDIANQRHLAWIFGNGHPYADLEKVANKHDYAFCQLAKDDEADTSSWVAVRMDLISESNAADDYAMFATKPGSLGTVMLALSADKIEDDEVGFVLTTDGAVTSVGSRVHELKYNEKNVRDTFEYTEILYSVDALSTD